MAFETWQRNSGQAALFEIANCVEYPQFVLRGTRDIRNRCTALDIRDAFDSNIQWLKRSRSGIRIMHIAQNFHACEPRRAADHAERTPSHPRRCIHSPSLALLLEARIPPTPMDGPPAPYIESAIAAPIRI
ncbi:hypothetical protein CBA19C8_13665 [Paraburkholderia terrae]|jgi:hypothetical protein|nr:hypothetical protein CBA19C8_13665 [Paraburkholderia terrae]GJH38464.1 hypothetical protein CBA19CS91_36925 [Paraburkholderia hospita]